MATVKMGEKWDMTSCSAISAETNSFDITDWPRGDHADPLDYSGDGECTESPTTCKAEMVVTLITGLSNDDVDFMWYDPFDRKIFVYSIDNVVSAYSWIGRFGEENLGLEIYRPGRYKCVIDVNSGSQIYTRYFDVYNQIVNQYVHKQGNNGTGFSWGAAKNTWYAGQLAMSSGNSLYVGEGDYSSESVTLDKTMDIYPTTVFGGYHNITDTYNATPGLTTPYLFADVGNPIEFDGTIDKWAFYAIAGSASPVKLKIYRGGDSGTPNATTSTLIYTSSAYTGVAGGWITRTISPQSVQRGDILGIQCAYPQNTIGLKSISSISANNYAASAATVSGDPSNTVIGTTGFDGYAIMVRAWNSTDEVILPVTP